MNWIQDMVSYVFWFLHLFLPIVKLLEIQMKERFYKWPFNTYMKTHIPKSLSSLNQWDIVGYKRRNVQCLSIREYIVTSQFLKYTQISHRCHMVVVGCITITTVKLVWKRVFSGLKTKCRLSIFLWNVIRCVIL